MDGWRKEQEKINEVEMRGNGSCATAGPGNFQPAWPWQLAPHSPPPPVKQGPIFNSLGCKTSKQPAGASEKALTPYFNFIIFDENVTKKQTEN